MSARSPSPPANFLAACQQSRLLQCIEPKDDQVVGQRGATTWPVKAISFPSSLPCVLCTAISGFARRRGRINAETQRFAEERRERRKKMLFSSALLRGAAPIRRTQVKKT